MRRWRNMELPREYRRWQHQIDCEMVDYFWGDLPGQEGPKEDPFHLRQLLGLEVLEENWDFEVPLVKWDLEVPFNQFG